MQSLKEFWISTRRVSTPIIAIESHDDIATQRNILDYCNDAQMISVWSWDCAQGFRSRNQLAHDYEQSLEGIEQVEDALLEIGKTDRIPQRSILLMSWRIEFWQSPQCRQAIINLREQFKRKQQAIVLILPYGTEIPADVRVHTISHQEALPDALELGSIAERIQEAARSNDPSIDHLEGTQRENVIATLRGMSGYQAEQQSAMATRRAVGIDHLILQQSKIDLINATHGLQVWSGAESFDDMAGCEGVKSYFRRLIAGRQPIHLVIWIDESEDMLAGTEGDLTGISQAYLGRLAGHLEDNKAQSVLMYGHPGTGKSLTAKTVASEAGCLCISFDLGSMKGGIVGESEQNLRRALAMERALVGYELGTTLWVWTTNAAAKLPPKIRSRMQAEFFYDTPSEQERLAIWALYRHKYELEIQSYPDDSEWTGREIERCCRLAWQMEISLRDASEYIVSRAIVDRSQIVERRKAAHLRYLSAQEIGKYRMVSESESERTIEL